ncbi:TetR family transcriptional regulator [Mycolicibacterium sp. CBMA 226]|uniref:TetR family transcriptional regulator n=1 Tax=Mycolicibacterium sp. CBMA 226 TaxID=2606611 RepID=UPI001307E612|nr:TetR family transcriptional regulator [Mycolicibacterium sp. CBMA 226]MUL80033.1 TetR family transcriptional regulator [Mycolicibacterium sp. CBMA 226]
MGRWEPNAQGRLEQAALELYLEQGFDETTVAEIAARAGLTERTFFRHFADKREVLFRGRELADALEAAIDDIPAATAPLDAVAAAVESLSDFFADRRPHARQRQTVISANPSLQERELIKLASLATSIRDALRRRGVGDPAASLVAETGVAVFKVAFEHWLTDPADRSLAEHVREALAELKAATQS